MDKLNSVSNIIFLMDIFKSKFCSFLIEISLLFPISTFAQQTIHIKVVHARSQKEISDYSVFMSRGGKVTKVSGKKPGLFVFDDSLRKVDKYLSIKIGQSEIPLKIDSLNIDYEIFFSKKNPKNYCTYSWWNSRGDGTMEACEKFVLENSDERAHEINCKCMSSIGKETKFPENWTPCTRR